MLVGGKNSKEKIENNKKTNNEKKIGLGSKWDSKKLRKKIERRNTQNEVHVLVSLGRA